MFNFLEELCELSDTKLFDIKDNYKLIMLGNNILYVANFKRVLAFTDNCIVLKVGKGELSIEGICLTIKSLEIGEIIIKGTINQITFAKVSKWVKLLFKCQTVAQLQY